MSDLILPEKLLVKKKRDSYVYNSGICQENNKNHKLFEKIRLFIRI